MPVGRLGGLLEQKEELAEAGLAGAVGTEEDRDGREADALGVLPGFEVLNSQVGEHRSSLVSVGRQPSSRTSYGGSRRQAKSDRAGEGAVLPAEIWPNKEGR